jgi:hypothetical protein
MRLENTVRGCSSAMTSDSGSLISGLSQMNYGLYMVDRPILDAIAFRIETSGNIVMKTVLITGCSSGYGLAARHFHAQGWNVIATMRCPREDVLPRSERLRVLPLDVTKPDSIAAALAASGPIDVLVNNAGSVCSARSKRHRWRPCGRFSRPIHSV